MDEVKFVDNSGKLLDYYEEIVLRTMETIGLQAERDVKDVTPVDTGRLRNSITHATSKSAGVEIYKDNYGKMYTGGSARRKEEGHTVTIGTNVEYAVHQEFSGNQGKGYMKFGISNNLDKYQTIAKRELEDMNKF